MKISASTTPPLRSVLRPRLVFAAGFLVACGSGGAGGPADGGVGDASGADGAGSSGSPPPYGLACGGAGFRMSGTVGDETFDVTGTLTSYGQNNVSTPRTAHIAYDSDQGKGYVNFTYGSPPSAIVRIPSGTTVCATAINGGTSHFELTSFVAYRVSGTSGKCDPQAAVAGSIRGCSSYD